MKSGNYLVLLVFFITTQKWIYGDVVVVVVVAVTQSCNLQVILAGYRRLLRFLTGTLVTFVS